jgi:hypothetical protein
MNTAWARPRSEGMKENAVTKKSKVEDSIPLKPISAAEHRRLDKRIKKKHEKLRRRYPEVHGKKVDWISHWSDEGLCFFSVCFTDGKEFSIVCHPDLVTDAVDLSDWKTGDEVILRKYYRRKA